MTATCDPCGAGRARHSPIRYEIVLFSDHGQTPSIPFRLLYGQTIAELMDEMLDRALGREAEMSVRRPGTFSPDRSYTLALLTGNGGGRPGRPGLGGANGAGGPWRG